MKKWSEVLKNKCNMVTVMNACALIVAINSVNAACFWAHHQPEVPEDLKRFRRF